MHMSSLENMEKCYQKYVRGTPLEAKSQVLVLDVGGADVNGSYRDVFSGPQFSYFGCDLAANDGVSIVLEDPYKIPLDDRSMDIVVSGQMLEHCEFFWLSFTEMMRVLRSDGYLFLIAPSAGKIHRYPVDCYRFYPDAYRALAKYVNCELVDVWLDERGPWRDLVGVFRHRQLPAHRGASRPPKPAYDLATSPAGSPEEEKTQGQRPYLEVLAALHDALRPGLYLEIGVRHGRSLALAKGPAVGVDPAPEVGVPLPETTRVVRQTSDDFFAADEIKTLLPGAVDFAFIDGMHLFENVLRDFMNIERHASAQTLVVVDDVLPSHPAQAERDRRTKVWTGDVWKIARCLQQYRPDLFLLSLDTAPTGLLLIAGLDPKNKALVENYNPICRRAIDDVAPVPPDVLARQAARAPTSELLASIAAVLRECRGNKASAAVSVQRLREATT